MKDLEEKLRRTDFSKYTDLKERLAGKLFSENAAETRSRIAAIELSDDDVEMIAAARGSVPEQIRFPDDIRK